MLRLYSSQTNCLFHRLMYFTKKSRSSNTPCLIKNPKLTPLGLATKKQKSYDYNPQESLPNRHLFWDRKTMNRAARKRHSETKLIKLGISPIHNNGVRTYQRDFAQILLQLSSIKLIKASLNRTMENLQEIIFHFPNQIQGNDRQIMLFAIKQIQQRNLPTMPFYAFTKYCNIRRKLLVEPNEKMLIHFYRILESCANKDKIFYLRQLGQISKHVLSKKYGQQYQNFFYQQKPKIKLFEDNPPIFKSIEKIMLQMYSDEDIRNFKENQSLWKKYTNWIAEIPGGNTLLKKIQQSA